MTIKEVVQLVQEKITNEEALTEAATLFDINLKQSGDFLHKRILFTQSFYRLLKESEDSEFYAEMLLTINN